MVTSRISRRKKHTSRKKGPWQIQEAKAKFSELIDDVLKHGMQKITKYGEEIVVILSKEEFHKLSKPKESLIDFFKKSPCQDIGLDLSRDKELVRDIDLYGQRENISKNR
jgi:prevent-host-death family protein